MASQCQVNKSLYCLLRLFVEHLLTLTLAGPISFFQSRFPAFAAQSLGGPIDARLEAVSVAAPAPPPSGSRVRTLFPETWLWNEGITKYLQNIIDVDVIDKLKKNLSIYKLEKNT